VAILGRKGEHEFWARVGRIRIISQITDGEAFLHADSALQENVLTAIGRTGAGALVAGRWAASHPGLNWQRLGQSDYYVIQLAGHPRHHTHR
jgi:hypothetical protein